MCDLHSVLLLCAIVLAHFSRDEFNHMGYSGIGMNTSRPGQPVGRGTHTLITTLT